MPENNNNTEDWVQNQIDSNLKRIYRQPAEGKLPDRMAQLLVKWSQKTGQRAKVYPEPSKGYENGEAPEVYRPV